MKCIATLIVDLERTPLGTRSRLADDLAGVPVLRRTVERVARARRIDSIYLLTPPDQADRVGQIVSGIGGSKSEARSDAAASIVVEPIRVPPAPFAELVRAGRMWGLNGWRGGIGGLCSFDEDMNAALLAAIARKHGAEVVAAVPAAAAIVDPALIDAMIDHQARIAESYLFAFAQSPPGLTPLIARRSLLEQLAPNNEPVGLLLACNPDRPFPDLTGKEPCYRLRAEVVEASGRLICDTRRSFERVGDLLADGGADWDAVRIGNWLQDRAATHVEPVPCELEIELTTGSEAALRPAQHASILRPVCAAPRSPIGMETIRRICDDIRTYDDVAIVLGGHGDPLGHPALGEICRMFRANAAAVAVRTFARHEEDALDDALFETPVDVIEVMLDAATGETYRRLHGVDTFDAVMARVERWLSRREKNMSARPLIVPSFVKCTENLDEMEGFYATWQRRLGMALLTGHTGYGGRWKSLAVTSMEPPGRGPCRRTRSRMMILADGRVSTCDQDHDGLQTTGSLREDTLLSCWRSSAFEAYRSGQTERAALCPQCTEWHRP